MTELKMRISKEQIDGVVSRDKFPADHDTLLNSALVGKIHVAILQVVHALADEGFSAEQLAKALKGVSPEFLEGVTLQLKPVFEAEAVRRL